ncbi:hypothetical protein PanWU01x14_340440 [Parasponia andersonii]|uniref:Uncharacterized protein n=1 Tax=Parasponia andersonii TaxID=3476 RepID=A0A2P5AEE4_PARAD|nr:hypothetical protein PanWU01x14_340440 [Parasponia andersonii]
MVSTESERLVTLKELVPLHPWRTPSPPFPGNKNGQYVKIKKPILKDGRTKVFWAPKTLLRIKDYGEGIQDLKTPYEGFFEFVDNFLINNVRKWIDRLLGQIFSLPKYDASSKTYIRG